MKRIGQKKHENIVSKKLRSNDGATLLFALLFFVVCAVAGSIAMSSASGFTGSLVNVRDTDAEYYAVSSAAKYLIDALAGSEFTIADKKTETYKSGNESEPTSTYDAPTITYKDGELKQTPSEGEESGDSLVLNKLKECFKSYLDKTGGDRWASSANFKYSGVAVNDDTTYTINVGSIDDLRTNLKLKMNENGGISMVVFMPDGKYALQIDFEATLRTSEETEYKDNGDDTRSYETTKTSSITYDKSNMTVQRTFVSEDGD